MPTSRARVAVALAVAVASTLSAAVLPADAGTTAPSSSTAIHIAQPTGDTPQAVDPYPSRLTTWGIDGPIIDVNVDLDNVNLGYAGDVVVVLVSPEGTAVALVAGACNNLAPVTRQYWTFDDEAPALMPPSTQRTQCASGRWRPTVWGATPTLPAPAPAGTGPNGQYLRSLAAFRGENPNGTWRLYVHDRYPLHPGSDGQPAPQLTDRGVIAGGFRVVVTTQSRSLVIPGDADGEGPASRYPLIEQVSGLQGRIADTTVVLHNLSHSFPDDLEVLLVAPGGQKVLLMSDVCGAGRVPDGVTRTITDAAPAFPDTGGCRTPLPFSPTDYEPGENLPAPAPPGPYSTSLSSLDGIDPNGAWKLYIADDAIGDSGYLEDMSLAFDLTAAPPPPDADTVAPNTRIVSHPAARTSSRRARFTFAGSERPLVFQCRLDARQWKACASPRTFRGLTVARHRLRVRAADAAGNVDPTPATWSWRVRR